MYISISIYIVIENSLSCLEEKQNIIKDHTGDELIEIKNSICDIKEVLSKKPNEDDLILLTSKMDFLFNKIDKEMEMKYAGKN